MAITLTKLEAVLGLKDAYSAELSKAQRSFHFAGGAITSVLKAGAIAAAAALGAASYAIYKVVQAANEAEAAEKRLYTALGYTSNALLNQAAALQKVTTYEDDQITQAQALIAAFVKDEAQIKAATKATLDFAAAKGMDLTAAADLVSKTLGSSTNALARYGIGVEGAVGSTERLNSLTEKIARTFGGQAAAAAETFGGKLAQVKNAYGGLLEEMGFVITKNTFFIKGLDLLQKALFDTGARVKENRLALMEMTKSGILGLVHGLGGVVEVMRFFHNGWIGLQAVAHFATIGIADGLRLVLETLNLVLWPFKKLFDALVQLGVMAANPLEAAFSAARDALAIFQESSRAGLKEVISNAEGVNVAYDKIKKTIEGIEAGLKGTAVAQATDKTGPKGPGITVKSEDKQAASGKAAAKASATTDAHVEMFYQEQELQKLIQGSYQGHYESLVEMHARYGSAVVEQELQKSRVMAYLASQTFGMMANAMQNLTVLTGKEGGAAFKVMKAFAIAETTIQTYRAAQGAYAALASIPVVGPALGVAAAVAATIAGLARVKQIQSMQPGGSASGATIGAGGMANPSYSGGSPSAYPVPTRTEEKPAQNITVIILNGMGDAEYWKKITEENIVPAINDASERNVNLVVKYA